MHFPAKALGLSAFLLVGAVRAEHAAVVAEAEAQALSSLLKESRSVRSFCLPCGDTAWTAERVGSAEAIRARPGADEWAVLLNGKPVDAAYVYVQRNGRWENAAWSAGLRFPDIPPTLKGALRLAEIEPADSTQAFFSWSGLYVLEDTVRRADARHATTLTYTLKMFDLEDSLTAELEANGIGVAHRMSLRVAGGGDSVTLALKRYLKGNFGKPHPPGARLFTLIRGPDGSLRTRWHSLRPKSGSAASAGFARKDLDPRTVDE
jgi:hypothetical protein